MAAGDSGSTGHTLIKGLRRWVSSYRKGKGIKGRWKHKGNEVGLRLLPFPPGNLISIHLMLASSSYTTRNGPGRFQLRTHLQ